MLIQIRTLCNKLFHNNMASTVETYKRGHEHGMLNCNPLVLTLILCFVFLKKMIHLLSKIVSLTSNKN